MRMRLRGWRFLGALDRLHIWHKLALLGVIFALLFAIPTTLFLRQVAGGLAQSSRELRGADAGEQALALLQALADHRALAAASLAADGDSAVRHSARIAFLNVPALAEAMGQAEATGIAFLAAKKAAAEDRTALSNQLARVKERSTTRSTPAAPRTPRRRGSSPPSARCRRGSPI